MFKIFRDNTPLSLLANVGIMILLIFFALFLFFKFYLPVSTNHGITYVVPNFISMTPNEAEEAALLSDVQIVYNDTTWVANFDPGTITHQHPEGQERVKEGRKIYLTLNSPSKPEIMVTEKLMALIKAGNPEDVKNYLKRKKFEVYQRKVESPYEGRLKACIHNGDTLKLDSKIPFGSSVTLLIGDGKEIYEEIIEPLDSLEDEDLIFQDDSFLLEE